MYRLTIETNGRVGEPWAQPLTVARESRGASYSIFFLSFFLLVYLNEWLAGWLAVCCLYAVYCLCEVGKLSMAWYGITIKNGVAGLMVDVDDRSIMMSFKYG
ncbi:hypothetical protein P168DRAFT_37061 [Aspergillus campestris IBT 28561]|uniref:Uncharacterized protein n=1 Tax=Aspergillus campestris (strain IBT 28561) TaxID=1392248 RepID=A0A2I1CW93_ASPC2|nr:uncharacterized protein P168DRAFT_37061 [Aspergillus campestris IBT 28561]PKY01901.1 hypothetical protein P168DRAFT_37061 [Aspergillus campestris IBT 28561]